MEFSLSSKGHTLAEELSGTSWCFKNPCTRSLLSQLATVAKAKCNKNLATLSDVPSSIKFAWPPPSSASIPSGVLSPNLQGGSSFTHLKQGSYWTAAKIATFITGSGRQGHQEGALPEASVQFSQEGLLKWGVRTCRSQTGSVVICHAWELSVFSFSNLIPKCKCPYSLTIDIVVPPKNKHTDPFFYFNGEEKGFLFCF